MNPFLSIVVPVFNEEVRIRSFVDQMRGYLSTTTASWEIVVVDDGSSDGTKATVEELARADPRIRLLAGPHKGKGDAVRRGMLAAQVNGDSWPTLIWPCRPTMWRDFWR